MFNLHVVDALGIVSMRNCASRSDREGSCIVLLRGVVQSADPTNIWEKKR